MVSMKDIAKACSVSVATVSKALSGQPDIGEQTRELICKTADSLGYMTNSAARALKTNRTYNIGVLFVDERRSGFAHEYFSAVLESLKVEAEANGYDITFINSNQPHDKHKTYLEHCRYRGLDGVMIACIDFDNQDVEALINSDIPVVTVDRTYPDTNTMSVLSDNASGMKELVEYIISQGHKRIAYLSGETSAVTSERVTSYQNVMLEHGLDIPPEYHISTEYRNLTAARQYTRQLLSLPTPPSCIIYQDDYSAVGGMETIRDMGLSIPEDISVAGYDDIFIASQLRPRLTTVHQDTEVIGRIAAEKLISLIEHKRGCSYKPVIVDSCLEKGESVKPYTE